MAKSVKIYARIVLVLCAVLPLALAAGSQQPALQSSGSNMSHSDSASAHKCVLGSLICVHDHLKPFLLTALWLIFLIVLLLVFERSELLQHQQQHQQQHHAGGDPEAASAGGGRRHLSHRLRDFCSSALKSAVQEYLPTSCLLILLGLAFAACFKLSGYRVPHLDALDPGLFFHFLLPIIIVNAGLGVEKRYFYFNLPAILSFAVLGTVSVALLIGFSIYALSSLGKAGPFTSLHGISKMEALTFGALISAVDPVAVLALFEKMHLNKPLYMTLFGESVLNDAVSVVLYNMFTQAKASMLATGSEEWRPASLEIAGIAIYSLHVAASGLAIGISCGFAASGLMRVLPNAGNQNLAVLIVVLSGYISFYLAELIAASGILSTFVCSIVMSIYLANLTPMSQTFLRQSTKSYAEISEGFIYLVMGVSALNLFFAHNGKAVTLDVPFIIITLLLCLSLRFIFIYGIGYTLRLLSLTELRAGDLFILSYGGLRGAIALALSLMLSEKHFSNTKDHFFTCTMMLVLITCFVNGISLKPLIRAFRIKVDESSEDSLWEQIMSRTCDYVGFFVGSLTGYQPLMKRIYLEWNRLNDRYLRRALLKSKVYKESKDEGIYELHRKIVAEEFLKFATRNKSLVDLNVLRSDSMVYAIRRVSSFGNSSMALQQLQLQNSNSGQHINHSGNHNGNQQQYLSVPAIVRNALSMGDAMDSLRLNCLADGRSQHQQQLQAPCDPLLDLEALNTQLKAERDFEEQRNHHSQFMRDHRIINPKNWGEHCRRRANCPAHAPVRFSLHNSPEEAVEMVEVAGADSLPYSSRYYAQHPHLIRLPRGHDRQRGAPTAATGAAGAAADPAALHKKKSVSFASLSSTKGLLDHMRGRLDTPASRAGGDEWPQRSVVCGRFHVTVCNEEEGAVNDLPAIRVFDLDASDSAEDFRYEVGILDSLPWTRANAEPSPLHPSASAVESAGSGDGDDDDESESRPLMSSGRSFSYTPINSNSSGQAGLINPAFSLRVSPDGDNLSNDYPIV